MTAAAVIQPRAHWSRRQDRIKSGATLRIRVNCRPQMTSIPGVPGGVKHGISECTIYESDLDAVLAKVEDDAGLIPQAAARHRAAQRTWIARRLRVDVDAIPDDPGQWTDAMRDAESTYPGSLEREFFELRGGADPDTGKPYPSARGIRPLIALTAADVPDALEVRGGVAIMERCGPMMGEEEARHRFIAEHGASSSNEALMAKLDALLERVTELEAENSALRGKKRS